MSPLRWPIKQTAENHRLATVEEWEEQYVLHTKKSKSRQWKVAKSDTPWCHWESTFFLAVTPSHLSSPTSSLQVCKMMTRIGTWHTGDSVWWRLPVIPSWAWSTACFKYGSKDTLHISLFVSYVQFKTKLGVERWESIGGRFLFSPIKEQRQKLPNHSCKPLWKVPHGLDTI